MVSAAIAGIVLGWLGAALMVLMIVGVVMSSSPSSYWQVSDVVRFSGTPNARAELRPLGDSRLRLLSDEPRC